MSELGQPTRVYIRVSHRDEADILDHQREAVHDYVERTGLTLVKLYEETASGGDDDRIAFNDLLREVRRGELVIFTSLSRMTRGGIGAAWDLLRLLDAKGVGWHFIEQPLLNKDADTPKLVRDVIMAVIAAVDEDYRRRISEATKAALRKRKALGHPIGRQPGAKDKRKRRARTSGPRPDDRRLGHAN